MDNSERYNPRLEIFKAHAGTDKLRDILLRFAEAGITHIDADLSKVASQEVSLERVFRNDPSHDFLHSVRVLRLAENMSVVGGDIDIIRAVSILHDYITYAKNTPNAKNETRETAAYVRDMLEQMDFPKHKIEKVITIIIKMSLSAGEHEQFTDENGYIPFAADKVDQTGAIGIMRYSASGGQMNRPPYNEDDILAKNRKLGEFDYSIDAMLVRLPKIEKSLRVPMVKATAHKRNEFFQTFLNELSLEVGEDKARPAFAQYEVVGAKRLMNIFAQAGKEGKPFYDLRDPFCQKRKPQPETFALDAVIAGYLQIDSMIGMESEAENKQALKRRKLFIEGYFTELKYEISGELELPRRMPKMFFPEQ